MNITFSSFRKMGQSEGKLLEPLQCKVVASEGLTLAQDTKNAKLYSDLVLPPSKDVVIARHMQPVMVLEFDGEPAAEGKQPIRISKLIAMPHRVPIPPWVRKSPSCTIYYRRIEELSQAQIATLVGFRKEEEFYESIQNPRFKLMMRTCINDHSIGAIARNPKTNALQCEKEHPLVPIVLPLVSFIINRGSH